ncbi:MAG: phosphate acetyltransferase [Rhodobacterales bacterium]|nr:phosphate acetyltransferase [Rhodobacterales bacterium]
MKVGDRASITRAYAAADLALYRDLAGLPADTVLAHVPEPLIGGLFSYLLGAELPGFGTNYLKQDLRFLRPAPADGPLTATVEITRIRPDKHLVDLATTCTDAHGTLVCDGRALVLVKDVGHGQQRQETKQGSADA